MLNKQASAVSRAKHSRMSDYSEVEDQPQHVFLQRPGRISLAGRTNERTKTPDKFRSTRLHVSKGKQEAL